MIIKSYKDLDVWKKSVDLVKNIYVYTKDFPKEEVYGIVNQIRRCAVSIPSNIAEGKSRQYTNEYVQFLYIAIGSCSELETQIIIAKELKYIDQALSLDVLEKIDHIGKMLRNLIKGLREPKT